MDKIFKIVLRDYLADPTDENAHRVTRLVIRASGSPDTINALPDKRHGFLTYKALLLKLLMMSEEDLALTATWLPATSMEPQGITHFMDNHGELSDIMKDDHPYLTHFVCSCGEPFSEEEIRQSLTDDGWIDQCGQCAE